MTKNISKLILFVSLISILPTTAWGAAANELQAATTNHGNKLPYNHQLHDAIVHGDVDKIKQLLEKDPNLPNQKDAQGNNLLHIAIKNNQPEIVQYLIRQYPAFIYQKNKQLRSPLATAISHKDLNTVKSILTVDRAILNEETTAGNNLFYIAASNGNLNIVEYMLEMDHTLPHRKMRKTGAIALHGAAAMGRLNVVQYLSEINPRLLNEKTNDGLTPLHLAASNRCNFDTVKYILTKNPTSIAQTDSNGCIPLHMAAINHCFNIFQYMIEIEPTLLDHKTKDGTIMLQYIVKGSNHKAIDLINLILQKCPFIDFRTKDTRNGKNIIEWSLNDTIKVALIDTLKNHLLRLHQDYPADQHIQCAVCMETATECPSCQNIADPLKRIYLLPCCLNILCAHHFALLAASTNPCPYCRKPLV